MKRQKLAILGASYLQRPLVEKANAMGIESHVFAWSEGNVVEDIATSYYPISILEKEAILAKCNDIGIDGITSIGSDIAMPTVSYVANALGLVGNSLKATLISTNKFEMRKALFEANIPCPRFCLFETAEYEDQIDLQFPVIVKPTDRSGSRGVTKVGSADEVNAAISKALDNSLGNQAIVEEFIVGREFSVEMISFDGIHYPLIVTDKVTTGAPHFVEIEHHQPADIPRNINDKIFAVVKDSLDALHIHSGASHSEVLLTSNGDIRVVEIAGRMGGELIGSDMVELSTGYDFVKGVIEVALGSFETVEYKDFKNGYSGVYYVTPTPGTIAEIKDHSSSFEYVVKAMPIFRVGDTISDVLDGAGKRAGVFVYSHPNRRIFFDPDKVLTFNMIS